MSLASSLLTQFGFDTFRAGQEEAVQSLLNKQHTLAIMPTGAGKSLIYQFAALQLAGLTLVISLLIALMKDQVDALNRKGIPATFINSAIPTAEQNQRLTLLSQGKYRLVYVAPERLRSVTFLRSLQNRTLRFYILQPYLNDRTPLERGVRYNRLYNSQKFGTGDYFRYVSRKAITIARFSAVSN